MDLIELILDETKQESGVNAISLVYKPAIKMPFIALSEQKEYKMQEVDAKRRILMGAVLVPEQPIFRKDPKDPDKGYYIFFSKETISRVSELFQKNSYQNETTEEHKTKLSGNTIVETWIKEHDIHDKSRMHGIDAPVGSWIVSMKCEDDETYQKALKGELTGFSIEGFFADKMQIKQSEEQSEDERIYNEILRILKDDDAK
jgi:hypothetical protein